MALFLFILLEPQWALPYANACSSGLGNSIELCYWGSVLFLSPFSLLSFWYASIMTFDILYNPLVFFTFCFSFYLVVFLLYLLSDYANAFDCVDHNQQWKILKEMGIPDHLTCLLRNLYAGQEATVRTGHGTTYWFQIWKGVCQGCILSPCLFNFYAEYIMRNMGLEEPQAGIKIARRNINHLRYADDTTLMAKSEEELKSLLMKVKEESEKV